METIAFGQMQMCRILNGMWQVAGGHGRIEHDRAIRDMISYHDSGFTSWDLADIYGPAEDFIGDFRQELAKKEGAEGLSKIQAFTKFVPQPGPMTQSTVERAINRSIKRMQVESIDLIQFHWWDYVDTSWLDGLVHLSHLRDSGKIRNLGLTNFDTAHMQEIADAGLRIISNQVQYSIIDQRPSVKMQEFCKRNNQVILAYGTMCGGFLSEKYQDVPEPSLSQLDTLSLRKYKKMIDYWGGWKLFQELLKTLKDIAVKHNASIANIATRYILDKPAVAGVIIGARLGISEHRQDNIRSFEVKLDRQDHELIEHVTSRSRNLFEIIGDCGDEYR